MGFNLHSVFLNGFITYLLWLYEKMKFENNILIILKIVLKYLRYAWYIFMFQKNMNRKLICYFILYLSISEFFFLISTKPIIFKLHKIQHWMTNKYIKSLSFIEIKEFITAFMNTSGKNFVSRKYIIFMQNSKQNIQYKK